MILTRFDRIVIDDMPANAAYALETVLNNYGEILNNSFRDLNYEIIDNLDKEEIPYWRSHRNFVYCYIVLFGQEIITLNDISDLELLYNYDSKTDTAGYRGSEQTRIRLKRDNIIIIYPEDAYKFHYIPGTDCRKLLVRIPFTQY